MSCSDQSDFWDSLKTNLWSLFPSSSIITSFSQNKKSKKKTPVEDHNNSVQPNIINLLDGSVQQKQYLSVASVSTQSDNGDHSSQSIETDTTTNENSTMTNYDRQGIFRRKPCIEVISQYTNTYDLEIAKEINELRSVLKILASAADKFLSDNNSKKTLNSNEPLKIEPVNIEDPMPPVPTKPPELPTVQSPQLLPVNEPLSVPIISPSPVNDNNDNDKQPVLEIASYVHLEDTVPITPLPEASSLHPIKNPSSVEAKPQLVNISNNTKATQIKQAGDFNLANYLPAKPRKNLKRCTSYDIFASEEILKATDMTSANEIFDFDRGQTSEATYCCLPKSRSLFELSTSTTSRAKLLNLFWDKYFEKNNMKDPFKQKLSSTNITKSKVKYVDKHDYTKSSKIHSVKTIEESYCKDQDSDDENEEISISVLQISPTVKEPLPKKSLKPIKIIDSSMLRTVYKTDKTIEKPNADAESMTLFKNQTNYDDNPSFDSKKDDSWEDSQVEIGASSYFGKTPTSVCFSCVSHSRYAADKFEQKQSKLHPSPKFNTSSVEYSSVTFSNPADGGDAPRKHLEDPKISETNVIGGASSSFIVEISSSEKGSDQNVLSDETLTEKSNKRWYYYSVFLVVAFVIILAVVYIYVGGKKIKLWKRTNSRMNKKPRYRKLSEYGF
ncbi:uncharacterized protein LOC105383583 isoform X3 [Plutella xylostella]|uniref:uncharacterized protein LOC105383583 isoform X3 n=1 Tax=Plutella xylostella TaxID=51655 RepID=UPI002032A436|nr:uncharacterized protein LOC105383583 isoform X3 [Plutella xylostella]